MIHPNQRYNRTVVVLGFWGSTAAAAVADFAASIPKWAPGDAMLVAPHTLVILLIPIPIKKKLCAQCFLFLHSILVFPGPYRICST